jgi:hypothetical protein
MDNVPTSLSQLPLPVPRPKDSMMLMRACRHNNEKEKLTPCQFLQSDLTSKMFCYINSMYSTVSEMSVFKDEERLQVKKVNDRVTQPRRDREVL